MTVFTLHPVVTLKTAALNWKMTVHIYIFTCVGYYVLIAFFDNKVSGVYIHMYQLTDVYDINQL